MSGLGFRRRRAAPLMYEAFVLGERNCNLSYEWLDEEEVFQ